MDPLFFFDLIGTYFQDLLAEVLFPSEQLDCADILECLGGDVYSLFFEHFAFVLFVGELEIEVLDKMVAEEHQCESDEEGGSQDLK